MTITWFKLHHEIITDIKLRRFTPSEKWAWIVLLTLSSQSSERGIIKADDEDIADFCEFNTTQDWLYYRDKLIAKGMVELSPEGLKILNWEKRQYKYPSDNPESTKERKRKQRAKSKENVTNVTSMSRVSHETDTDTDPDPDPDQKRLEKNSLSPTPQMQNAERERIFEKNEMPEKPEKPIHNPLAQLEPETKAAFLKFCKQHYEANNPGKHLALAQEYAKKYFNELWELFQNSIAPKANLEPSVKNEETAIAICENFPVEQWPQWIVKFVPHTGEYYKRFEAFMMSPRK